MSAYSSGVAAAALLGVFLLQLLPAVSHASEADLSQLAGPAGTNRKTTKLGRVRSPSPDLSMSGGGERLSCGRHGFAPHINPVHVGIGGLSLGQPVKPVQKQPSLNWSGRNSPTGEMKGQTAQPYKGPLASDNGGLYHTPISDEYPRDYFGVSTRGLLLPSEDIMDHGESLNADELSAMCNQFNLDYWGCPAEWGIPACPERAVFCSQSLNMRSIRLIGYDMDYTLIHYKVKEWEGKAYFYAKENLLQVGFPVDDLEFQADLVSRGLVIDKDLGNIIKVDRFGKVRRAMHGLQRLPFPQTHDIYGDEVVDLKKQRYVFLNTLFSVSEGCLFLQLVAKYDAGDLIVKDDITGEVLKFTYEMLFNAVSKSLFRAHVEGRLKADVMRDPEKYVEMDPELPLTLLDQREAGKKLALITNSEWGYTKRMMSQVFDRFLPKGILWRDLFDVILVNARKPQFFSQSMPLYEIVTEDGMMRERMRLQHGRIYSGGTAAMVEKLFGVSGEEIAYIGDHIFTDVNVAKCVCKWKTVLVVRELEEEVIAMNKGRNEYIQLLLLIKRKDRCENIVNHLRTELNRHSMGHASLVQRYPIQTIHQLIARILVTIVDVENQIIPALANHGAGFNPAWGYMSRAGLVDKSHLMRQIEKYADLYTSRVSNFLRYSPYMYFRASQLSLAHNPKVSPEPALWQVYVGGQGAQQLRGLDNDARLPQKSAAAESVIPTRRTLANQFPEWTRGAFGKVSTKPSPVMKSRTDERKQARGISRVASSKEFGGHHLGLSGVPLLDAQRDSEAESEGIVDLGWDYASKSAESDALTPDEPEDSASHVSNQDDFCGES